MPRTPTAPRAAASGLRSTRQGNAVLRALDRATVFLSAQDLHAQMRSAGEGVGLTTVYRHLGLFADAGVIDQIHREDGSTVYRRCHAQHHHHHIVCRHCGTSVEIDDPGVETWATKAAKKAGFTNVEHTVELHGTCRTCAKPPTPRP